MTDRPVVLRVDDLSFRHDESPALFTNWSASFAPGVTVVRGDTGSGKTTLLRLLSGEATARRAQGDLSVDGIRHADDPEAYRREIFWCDPAAGA